MVILMMRAYRVPGLTAVGTQDKGLHSFMKGIRKGLVHTLLHFPHLVLKDE